MSDYLTPKQVGDKLAGTSSDTILRWFHEGIIPGLQLGRKILFDFAEVEEALAKLKKSQMAKKRASGLTP